MNDPTPRHAAARSLAQALAADGLTVLGDGPQRDFLGRYYFLAALGNDGAAVEVRVYDPGYLCVLWRGASGGARRALGARGSRLFDCAESAALFCALAFGRRRAPDQAALVPVRVRKDAPPRSSTG